METTENTKQYRFTDENERMKVINRLLTLEICMYYAIVIASSTHEIFSGNLKKEILSLIITSIIFAVATIALYYKDKASKINSYIILTLYYITFFCAVVLADIQLTLFTSIVVLAALIERYNKRLITVYSAVSISVEIINCIYHIPLKHESSLSPITLLGTMIVYIAAVIAIYFTTIRSIQFNRDIVAKIEAEKNVQVNMLNDVIHITKVVKEDIDESNNLVLKLGNTTQTANSAVKEISLSTQSIADSIQMQTGMTQNIQKSIENTVELSDEMKRYADESRNRIAECFKLLNNIKEHSAEIARSNTNVDSSMRQLSQKAESVQNIAGIIAGISKQTNLLALNASIEATRAGKGFAVVAVEIQKLSDEVKKAIDSITRTINELNEQVAMVSHNVKQSIESTDKQDIMIASSVDIFHNLNGNLNALLGTFDKISVSINDLQSSNTKIVDNISEISATTEEVSAGSQEASNICEENYMDLERVIHLLNDIETTFSKLNKYINA